MSEQCAVPSELEADFTMAKPHRRQAVAKKGQLIAYGGDRDPSGLCQSCEGPTLAGEETVAAEVAN